LSGFQVQLLQNEVRIVRPVVGVFVVVVKRGMRSAPAVTEIATSHFPPRQTSKPFDVNDPARGVAFARVFECDDADPLPARFARLAYGFAVILVGKPVASAAAALSFAATATRVTAAVSSAAAIAAEAASAAIPSARRSAAFATRPRLIHLELTAAGRRSIQASDRLGRFLVIRHFDESEPARASGLAVHRHVYTRHGAKWFEQRTQLTLTRLKIQIPHKQTLHLPFSSGQPQIAFRTRPLHA
jgi:hypothetical protein